MKLNEKTLNVLRNFSTINANVVFNGSNILKTMSEGRNIMAKATIDNYPDREVGIYDLSNFLGTLGLMSEPEIKFNENNMLISDQSGRSRIEYFYSSVDALTFPKKDITMPPAEVTFTLDDDTLNRIRRASSALGNNDLVVTPDNGVLRLTVTDLKISSSNNYSVDVAYSDETTQFEFIFQIGNLKFIPGDYEVSLSSKLIAHFKHKSEPIEYWVAMEKDSVYS